METKVCKVCGQEKPIEDFLKSKTSKGGRANVCKKCHAEKMYDYNRERRKSKTQTLPTPKPELKMPAVERELLLPADTAPQAVVKYAPKLEDAVLRELEQYGLHKVPGRLLIHEVRRRGYRGELELVTVQKVVI